LRFVETERRQIRQLFEVNQTGVTDRHSVQMEALQVLQVP
jgi:hypothetical protein